MAYIHTYMARIVLMGLFYSILAAVAAKVVANVLRSHSQGQIRRPAQPLLGRQDDSTDTEDSDDSGSEELPTKKPVDLHPTPPIR